MSLPPPAPSAPPEQRGFPVWAPFVALITAFGAAVVAAVIIAGIAGQQADDPSAGVTLAATFVQDGLLLVAMIAFTALNGLRPTPGLFGLRHIRDVGDTFWWSAATFVVFFVFLLLWSRLEPSAKDDLLKDLGAKNSTATAVAVIALVSFIAPVVEELFFRGFLFSALSGAMNYIPAALIGGVVFGGIHAGGTPAIFLVPLALLGFLLCLLYRRVGSVIPGMGVHSFNNSLSVAVGLHWALGAGLAIVIIAPCLVMALVSLAAD